MRLSANLGFLWPDLPLLERIDAAALAGFEGVELHWPYQVPPQAVRARCLRHDLKLIGINTARGDTGEFGLGCLPGRQVACQATVDEAIRYAVAAGAGAIHVLAGRAEPGDRDAARRTMIENLQVASAKAAPHGLALLVEALNPVDAPGYLYSTAADAAAVVAEAGCPNVRLLFDCYHVGAEGDVAAKMERHLPVVGHVQIAAVPTRHEPDEGVLDYRTLLSTLASLGYDGWVGAEYKPRAATDAGLGWIRTVWPENATAGPPDGRQPSPAK